MGGPGRSWAGLGPTSLAREDPGSRQPGGLPTSQAGRGEAAAGPGGRAHRIRASSAAALPGRRPRPGRQCARAGAARCRARARWAPGAEGSAPAGCASAIRVFGSAGGSVYKHTARSPRPGVNLKVGGRRSGVIGDAGGETSPCPSAGCWLRGVAGLAVLPRPRAAGRHVVRTWSGPGAAASPPPRRRVPRAPWRLPGATPASAPAHHASDGSSGLSGRGAWGRRCPRDSCASAGRGRGRGSRSPGGRGEAGGPREGPPQSTWAGPGVPAAGGVVMPVE